MNISRVLSILQRKESIWSKLWQEISQLNKSDICTVISILYPKIYKGDMNQNYFYTTDKVSTYDSTFFNSEKSLKWPDDSYSRMISVNSSFYKKTVLMGQKYIQNEIWRRQHPKSCSNVTFCLIQSRATGLGCDLHSYAISMSFCLSQPNTVFDFVPEERDVWTKGNYCKAKKSLLCFFEPLTNCSIPKQIEERKRRTFKRKRQQGFVLPKFAENILKKSLIAEEYYEWYWIVSASTYFMRLNERTKEWLDSFEKSNLINPKPFYDIGIHVRHGDKYKEMTLIKAKNYMPAINIYKKIMDKNLSDINVFLSTEDPDVINWFVNYSGCSVSYINYNRNNPGQKEMVKMGDALALISLANLRLSLKTNIRVDTMASNWNRLVLELMQTFAENSNVMVFEMGIMRSLTAEHYKLLKNWRIAEKWSFLPDKKYFNETDDK